MFSEVEAGRILDALGAEIVESPLLVAVVRLGDGYRLRLHGPRASQEGSLPSYVRHRWREELRFTSDEFSALAEGRMTGAEALELVRRRYGL